MAGEKPTIYRLQRLFPFKPPFLGNFPYLPMLFFPSSKTSITRECAIFSHVFFPVFFRKNLQDVAPRLAKELAWLKLSIFTHTTHARGCLSEQLMA